MQPANSVPPARNIVCQLGHLITTAELREHGISAGRVQRGLQTGALERVARGIYACVHADADQRLAAGSHARITCLSALRRAGVWAGTDASAHLSLAPNGRHNQAHVTRDLAGHQIRYHWSPLLFPESMVGSWLVSPMDAVWQAIHCLDEENAIACLESAVHEKFLTEQQVRTLTDRAPARLQPGISEMEFTAGSGLETLIRRKLRRVGYSVEAQVRVAGVGDEDLVVEDCVALEADGEKWHGPDRFHHDRRRDLKTEGLGRRTLRVTYALVMFEWASTLATIDRVVADAKREQARRNGRIIIHPGEPH